MAAAERASGLRDTVPVGAALPMTAGSAAQVLLAWEEGERMHRGLRGAKFTATTLAGVRRRGWAASAAEREPGVASVSAPVRGAGGKVLAAVSVSGPIERLTRSPGRLHAAAVVAAGEQISELLRADVHATAGRNGVPQAAGCSPFCGLPADIVEISGDVVARQRPISHGRRIRIARPADYGTCGGSGVGALRAGAASCFVA